MTKNSCIIFKIHTEKIGLLKEWGRELSHLEKDAHIILKEENVRVEFLKLFQIKQEWYGVSYMECFENMNFQNPNTSNKINQKHRKILAQCIEEKYTSLEDIYSFFLEI